MSGKRIREKKSKWKRMETGDSKKNIVPTWPDNRRREVIGFQPRLSVLDRTGQLDNWNGRKMTAVTSYTCDIIDLVTSRCYV